jgi:hypothetical protein
MYPTALYLLYHTVIDADNKTDTTAHPKKMAPRTIYTLGGRYKTIDAVEDAPFGEFITVRDTGLIFNVVHPIPEQYIEWRI